MCESLVIAFRLICMVLHVCVCVFTRQGIYVCDKHTLPCEFYVNISEIFFSFFFAFSIMVSQRAVSDVMCTASASCLLKWQC